MDTKSVFLTIKRASLDEDERVLTGWATKPEVDRAGDVILPEGVQYKLPIPFLLDHDHEKSVGEVEKVEVSEEGIKFTARIKKIAGDSAVARQCTNAWELIKNGLRRHVSIGFRNLESIFNETTGGFVVTKWEWLELSAVTIPACAGASILTTKSLPKESPVYLSPDKSRDKFKTLSVTHSEDTNMKTIAEHIESIEKSLDDKRAEMKAIAEKAMAEDRTMDGAEAEAFESISAEIKKLEADKARFVRMAELDEKSVKPVAAEPKAAPVSGTSIPASASLKRDDLPKGVAFARAAKCIALGFMSNESPVSIAEKQYGERAPITAVVRHMGKKALGSPFMESLDASGNPTLPAIAEFVDFARSRSILGVFGTSGVPAYRNVPFNVPIVTRSAATAGWVGESEPKPVVDFTFSNQAVQPSKIANIAVASMELIRSSSVDAEVIIRDAIADAIVDEINTTFAGDAAAVVTSGAVVKPAGIFNGAHTDAAPTSGGSADEIRANLIQLISNAMQFSGADRWADELCILMHPQNAVAVASLYTLAAREFPDMTFNGGRIMGLPVIVTSGVPTDRIAAINARNLLVGTDGGIDISMSREASVTASGTGGTQRTVSLWQNNLIGFRAEQVIGWGWLKGAANSATVLTGITW